MSTRSAQSTRTAQSTRSARRRRSATVLTTVLTATGLLWAGPSAAGAAPGVFDSDTCQESLTRVWSWPGEMQLEANTRYVFFSDAYEGYVLRQPPCHMLRPAPSTYDRDRVGHVDAR